MACSALELQIVVERISLLQKLRLFKSLKLKFYLYTATEILQNISLAI